MTSNAHMMIAALAAGGSAGCLSWLLFTTLARARERAARLELAAGVTLSPLLRVMRPAARLASHILAHAASQVEMRVGREGDRSFLAAVRLRVAKMLVAAGRPENLSPDEFIGLMLVAGFFGLIIGLIGCLRVPLGFVPLLTLALGAVMPAVWLRGQIRSRQMGLRRVLPFALDLLTLSVEAGLDFTEALARIVRRLGNTPLAVELGETLRQIQLGKTRADALRDLAERVDLPELRSVVGALIQTDKLGGNLAPALRAQAIQLRNTRSQYAEKLAMEAPVKILLPLIAFIFPTIFIIIFGPIILMLLKQ